jgi:hypothetical protein
LIAVHKEYACRTEDAKSDKLRRLPMYKSRIIGWEFVCMIAAKKRKR